MICGCIQSSCSCVFYGADEEETLTVQHVNEMIV